MIAIYARQSKDKKESISIESQIEFCKKEVVPEEQENIIVYKDKGFSGKNLNRPGFDKMYTDIKDGVITTVIVYKLDRISRNLMDFCNLYNKFKQYNVSFISCNEKFDTSTGMGQAMLSICMVFAELERNTIQARLKDSYYVRAGKGFYSGGKVPYGYTKIDAKIDGKKTSSFESNQDAWIIKELFEQYAISDHSLGDVAKYMDNKGTVSANGCKWDSNKVGRILRNPFYVKADADVYLYYKNKGMQMENDVEDYIGTNGLYLYNKRDRDRIINKDSNGNIIGNHVNKNNLPEEQHVSLALHKGLIDSQTFLTCQYKLDTNKQIGNKNKGRNSWLSGIIKCGYCGYAVSVVKNSKGMKYFNCRGKTNLHNCNGHSRTIFVEDVEEAVKKRILTRAKRFENIKKKELKNGAEKQNELKILIINIDKQIENLVQQVALGNEITAKYLNAEITRLDKQKNELIEEQKKEDLLKNKQKNHSMKDMIVKLEKFDDLDFDVKKQIGRIFINKVLITDDKINIVWNDL